jgi:hypothetical protein
MTPVGNTPDEAADEQPRALVLVAKAIKAAGITLQ